MAARMRIVAVMSLVVILVSPSRVLAAQLPVPVSCIERCPINDADCVDACRQQSELERETEDGFPGGAKRASAFVRIGRPAAPDRRASSFIRIGKKLSPVETLDADKRKDSFIRIGRKSAYVRIGRDVAADNGVKRASSFVRIGRSSAPADVDVTGSKRRSMSFVRIGRGDESDNRWRL